MIRALGLSVRHLVMRRRISSTVIYEAPDATTAAASVSMMLGASTMSSSVETIQLFTIEQAVTAITKPGQVLRNYKPPVAI
jgi:hypothetical protein